MNTTTQPLEEHPKAAIFTMLEGEAYEQLRDDIHEHGLREKIILLDGLILDGRNRYKACRELGIEPEVQELEECNDALAYVLSANLHRRHLTTGERAAIAADYIPMLAEQAAKRKAEGQKSGGQIGGRGNKKPSGKKLSKGLEDGKATAQAAKLTNTNSTYVQAAKKLKDESPEVFEELRAGKINVPQAKRKAKGEPAKTGKPKKKAPKKPKAIAPAEPNIIGDKQKVIQEELDKFDKFIDDELEGDKKYVREAIADFLERKAAELRK
jgi:ParB-like chromosome segregation protein Spo0J